MRIKTIVVGPIQTNCYLLVCEKTKKCLIIDPGDEPRSIINEITKINLQPAGIINTHGHYDHIGANQPLKDKYKIPVSIHEKDASALTNPEESLSFFTGITSIGTAPEKILHDGDEIDFCSNKLKVIHTPGHTPGSICVVSDGFIFTGDTLFCQSIGRVDLPGGCEEQIMNSLEKLKKLPKELIIYPGHENACTLAGEFAHNPYLNQK
ncbi:MAG: hypothetical protein A2252_05425 [Elusimicrobia bacterium RIFOXYA2_FULL_39_19]|nr:MAG: hypothetical protein A2252_05425 [Elusimicrobia bacterium RIFOXYA2_FULL_39_19]